MTRSPTIRRRAATALLAAAAAGATLVPGAAGAHAPNAPDAPSPSAEASSGSGVARHPDHLPPEVRHDLRRARRATEAYRDVEVARADGYAPIGECTDDPKYGAMGIHFANEERIADGRLDIEEPEILVYQPTRHGGLRLVAIEYFQADADQDLHTDEDRPWLFDLPFDGPMLGHEPGMPIHYDLHVWLYRHNPAGLFAMWNPDVRCPDDDGHGGHGGGHGDAAS